MILLRQDINKRKCTPGFPDIEQALAICAECAIHDNQHLDSETLKEKARRFANITNFPASGGWLSNFKKGTIYFHIFYLLNYCY